MAMVRDGRHEEEQGDPLSAPEQVLAQLRDAVLDGRLPSGTRLKINDLASELGVSHMPVREALHLLVMEGLAIRLPRRGVLVRALTPEDVASAYDVLGNLEGLAARQAAQRITPTAVARLRRLLAPEASLAAAGEREALRETNLAFHSVMQELCPNNWATTFVRQLRNYTYRVRRAHPQSQARLEQVVAEHQALLAVLAVGDADAAEGLARLHNERACADVIRQLQQVNEAEAAPGRARRGQDGGGGRRQRGGAGRAGQQGSRAAGQHRRGSVQEVTDGDRPATP